VRPWSRGTGKHVPGPAFQRVSGRVEKAPGRPAFQWAPALWQTTKTDGLPHFLAGAFRGPQALRDRRQKPIVCPTVGVQGTTKSDRLPLEFLELSKIGGCKAEDPVKVRGNLFPTTGSIFGSEQESDRSPDLLGFFEGKLPGYRDRTGASITRSQCWQGV
jgi:hypothetical protein